MKTVKKTGTNRLIAFILFSLIIEIKDMRQ